jgi:hypothetical protein
VTGPLTATTADGPNEPLCDPPTERIRPPRSAGQARA